MSAPQTTSAASSAQPPRKTDKRVEQKPLVFAEEVVAPLDRRPQRLLTRLDSATRLEQVEARGEAFEQLLRRQDLDPRRRQLEGERQVVQPRAQFSRGRTRLETRLGRLRQCGEQLRRIPGLEGRHRVRLLARKTQELAAGDDELQIRAEGEQLPEVACRVDQMLEVVEEKEQPAVGDALGEPVSRLDRLRGLLQHELRVAERRERNPEKAVRIPIRGFRRSLKRKPRLPRAGRARQREQANVTAREQARHLVELPLPPEKRRCGNREVRLPQARERRKVALSELVDALRRGEVLETMLPQVAQVAGVDQRRARS
jgi:hypothetical protein